MADHWLRVQEVFEAGLAYQGQDRAAFIQIACMGDPWLKQQVSELLASHDQSEDFLEQPMVNINPAASAFVGRRIGPYRIVERIGRGGTSAVYLAERDDGQYNKQVAIKILRGELDQNILVRRFVAERQILAALEHPHIARLIDGGMLEEGLPYFILEYVEGVPIDCYCDAHKLSVSQRLELFLQVCEAVSYAHRNLVVHRDLKPGNILVTEAGFPKLLDFGIAKLLTPPTHERTATELRAMTLAYAAPEQVRGEPVSVATDVYSLGMVLYELLCGHRPYQIEGERPLEAAQRICEAEPLPPSVAVERTDLKNNDPTLEPESDSHPHSEPLGSLKRRLAGDLDNIVLKALQKEPKRRYASVEQFSEDIRRHLAGLPVTVRPDTFGYKASKFVQRNRLAVAAGAVAFIGLIGAGAGLAYGAWQARLGQIAAIDSLVELRLASDQQLEALTDALRVSALLQQTPGVPNSLQLETLAALQQAVGIDAVNLLEDRVGMAMAVTFSPDGRTIATANSDGQIRLWTAAGALLHRLKGHTNWTTDVRFSPDNRQIVSASRDGTLKLWSAEGKYLRTLTGHTGRIRAVVFSPDGKTLASASWDKTIRLWRSDGTPLAVLRGHRDGVLSVDFSPDGLTLASSGADGSLALWRRSGVLLKMVHGHTGKAPEVRFSPDGRRLASVGYDGLVRLWRSDLTPLQTLVGHVGEAYTVKFSPDGQWIASGGLDRTLRIWGAHGTQVAVFKGHKNEIYNLAFSPDSKTVASASADGSVRLWRIDNPMLKVLTAHSDEVEQVVFGSDGTLASAGSDGIVHLWKNLRPAGNLIGSGASVKAVAFAPDGKTMATANLDNTVRFWRSSDSKMLRVIQGIPLPPPNGGFVGGVAFSPDGQIVATANPDSTIRLLSANNGKLLKTFQAPAMENGLRRVIFSPDGSLLTAAGNDTTVRVWQSTGSIAALLPGHRDWVSEVAFSPDSAALASMSHDGFVRLWRTDGTALASWLVDKDDGNAVAFAPGRALIATGGSDGSVKLWDLHGNLLRLLKGHSGVVNSVAFSADSQLLVSGGKDGTIQVWNWDQDLNSLTERGCTMLGNYLRNSPRPNINAKTICPTQAGSAYAF